MSRFRLTHIQRQRTDAYVAPDFFRIGTALLPLLLAGNRPAMASPAQPEQKEAMQKQAASDEILKLEERAAQREEELLKTMENVRREKELRDELAARRTQLLHEKQKRTELHPPSPLKNKRTSLKSTPP